MGNSNSIEELFINTEITLKSTVSGEEALQLLSNEVFDCVIIDSEMKDSSVLDFLHTIKEGNLSGLPIIIYTGNEITENEAHELNKYADSIIIKGPKSTNRLLEEATLFLHGIERKMNVSRNIEKWTITEKDTMLKDKKILLVDDDMRNVFALSSVLETKGIKVVIGKNGKEGIEKLKSNSDISLILMDIMMPEMDGHSAIKQIRSQDKWKQIPIIALTAKAMKEDRNKCIEAGANDYMTKPVDAEKLISLIRVWMHK